MPVAALDLRGLEDVTVRHAKQASEPLNDGHHIAGPGGSFIGSVQPLFGADDPRQDTLVGWDKLARRRRHPSKNLAGTSNVVGNGAADEDAYALIDQAAQRLAEHHGRGARARQSETGLRLRDGALKYVAKRAVGNCAQFEMGAGVR